MRHVFGLFPLAVFLFLGCSASMSSPTPTPDVPKFASGEAIALLKEHLRGSYDPLCRVYGRDKDFGFTEEYSEGVWLLGGGWVNPEPRWKIYEHTGVIEPVEGTTARCAMRWSGEPHPN